MGSNIDISHPWYFMRELPLLGFSLPPKVDNQELVEFLAARDKVIRAITQPWASIVDITNLMVSSALQRNMFSEAEGRLTGFYRKHLIATSIVVANPFHRGIVTAMFWMRPPVYPYTLAANVDEGIRWTTAKLRAAGAVGAEFEPYKSTVLQP